MGLLAVGWAAALALYLSAAPPDDNPDVYDLEHSKRYLRQLEQIGGKATVLTAELNDFVASLWHGRALAFTVAALTALAAAAWALLPSRSDRA